MNEYSIKWKQLQLLTKTVTLIFVLYRIAFCFIELLYFSLYIPPHYPVSEEGITIIPIYTLRN